MNHRLTTLISLCCLALNVNAAEQPDPGKSAPKSNRLERLSNELGLTDGQRSQLKNLLKANKEKLKALKEGNQEQVDVTLTPEQKAKLEKLRQKRHALHGLKIKAGQ